MAIIDERMIDEFLRDMYAKMLKGHYGSVQTRIANTVQIMNDGTDVQIEASFADHIELQLHRIKQDLAARNPSRAHDRLRTMHYEIFERQLRQC
jgi:hypothetical protein